MSDFTIELATWTLNVRKVQAQIATENIASINSPDGKYKEIDFNKLMEQVAHLSRSGDIEGARAKMAEPLDIKETYLKENKTKASLDSEILELSAAEGRYKAIAKAMSLKMGLMSIAVTGSQR